MKHKWVFASSVLVWVLLVGAGETFLLQYSSTPALQMTAPALWPEGSQIAKNTKLPLLLLFVHPKCPCSRATVGELSKIMTHSQGKVSAYVLFAKPEGVSEKWLKSDLWKNASRIPGVQVLEDPNGFEAKRFHSLTSGQTLLYDAKGRLLFEGGITAARGHFGDNQGSETIKQLIQGNAVKGRSHFKVFGCALFNHNE